MKDKHNNLNCSDQGIIPPGQIDEESFLGEEDSVTLVATSASFCDIRTRSRKNTNDVSFPFANGKHSSNDITDWRNALSKVKEKIENIETGEPTTYKVGVDEEGQHDNTKKQVNKETKIEPNVTEKHDDTKRKPDVRKMRKLRSENLKITTRREGIMHQLQFPMKTLTTLGKYETLKGQFRRTNLIKVYADVSEYPEDYSTSSQADPQFSTKLKFREFTIVRNISGQKPDTDRRKDHLDDGLPSVGSYKDFIRNIPCIQYLVGSGCIEDVDDVDTYENFLKDFLRRPRFKLYGINCSLLVSSNLVALE